MAFYCPECGGQVWRHTAGTFICKNGHFSRESATVVHPHLEPVPKPARWPYVALTAVSAVALGELVALLLT